ncbi:hypothetical protein KQI84_19105 [bacterium]|nr:hypothetical protein [bacterium]
MELAKQVLMRRHGPLILLALLTLVSGPVIAVNPIDDGGDLIGDPTPSPTPLPPTPSPTPAPCRECAEGYSPAAIVTVSSAGCDNDATDLGAWKPDLTICGGDEDIPIMVRFPSHEEDFDHLTVEEKNVSFVAEYNEDADYCVKDGDNTDRYALDPRYYFTWSLPDESTANGIGRSSASSEVRLAYNSQYSQKRVSVSIDDKTCNCDSIHGTDVAGDSIDAASSNVEALVVLYRKQLLPDLPDPKPAEPYHDDYTEHLVKTVYDGTIQTTYYWADILGGYEKLQCGEEGGSITKELSITNSEETTISPQLFGAMLGQLGVQHTEETSVSVDYPLAELDGLAREGQVVVLMARTTFHGTISIYSRYPDIQFDATRYGYSFNKNRTALKITNYPCGVTCE